MSDDDPDKMGCKGSGLTLMKVLLPSALTHRNYNVAPVSTPLVSHHILLPISRSTHSVGSVSVEVMRDRSGVVREQHQTGVLRLGDLSIVPR